MEYNQVRCRGFSLFFSIFLSISFYLLLTKQEQENIGFPIIWGSLTMLSSFWHSCDIFISQGAPYLCCRGLSNYISTMLIVILIILVGPTFFFHLGGPAPHISNMGGCMTFNLILRWTAPNFYHFLDCTLWLVICHINNDPVSLGVWWDNSLLGVAGVDTIILFSMSPKSISNMTSCR